MRWFEEIFHKKAVIFHKSLVVIGFCLLALASMTAFSHQAFAWTAWNGCSGDPNPYGCEAGGPIPGASVVNSALNANVSGGNLNVSMSLSVGTFGGHQLGCYAIGDVQHAPVSYLITPHNATVTAPDGTTYTLTPTTANPASGIYVNALPNFRMYTMAEGTGSNAVFPAYVSYTSLPLSSLKTSGIYKISATRNRKDICNGDGNDTSQPTATPYINLWKFQGATDIQVNNGNWTGPGSVQYLNSAPSTTSANPIVTASVGDQLHWRIFLLGQNDSDSSANTALYSNISHGGVNEFDAAGFSGANPDTGKYADGSSISNFISADKYRVNNPNLVKPTIGTGDHYTTSFNSYKVMADDVGKTLCEWGSWYWGAVNDRYERYANAACAHIPYNYQITETGASQTSTNSDGTTNCNDNTVTVGTTGTIKWVLQAATSVNGNNATNSRNITWKVVDANGNIVASNAVNSAGTSVSGATGMIFAPGQTVTITVAAPTQTVAGQVTTYSLIVTDGTGGGTSTSTIETDSDSTITSTINKNSCSESVKSPSVQINGADSRAQTGFQGSNVSHVATNGSWSQYGLLSNSNNFTNFGSAGYVANSDSSSCKLWFANATGTSSNDCSGSTSGFALGTTFTRSLPTVKNLAYSNQSIVNLINLSDGVYAYAPTNNTLVLSQSSDISTGEHITIYVNGDISITSDIWLHTLSETYSSLNTIPSLTIYATGNINIYAGVSYIDANLISKNGTINDCSTNTAGSSLSYSENGSCDNQLVIDGSISTATTPHFTRTRGAEQDGSFMAACGNRAAQLSVSYSTPAECISYSPNLYLVPWFLSQKNSGGDINWQTIDETSLPARY